MESSSFSLGALESDQLIARRLYEFRRDHGPFRSREEFRKVPGLGEATFVQAAGFLKVFSGENPFDATWIHPESYEVAKQALEKLGFSLADLRQKETTTAIAPLPAGGRKISRASSGASAKALPATATAARRSDARNRMFSRWRTSLRTLPGIQSFIGFQ